MAPFVTFLTDFGLQDDFVGTCHGVIKRIAPEAEILDITHGVRPGAVLQGALVLANALPYMPSGVHLAVVDPGVGGTRRPLALQDGEGRLHVGPDNGLLLPAAEQFGGVAAVHELANPDYSLQPVSRTFHGRDLFAPAAAHLAQVVASQVEGHVPETVDAENRGADPRMSDLRFREVEPHELARVERRTELLQGDPLREVRGGRREKVAAMECAGHRLE